MRRKITALILCVCMAMAIFFAAPPAKAVSDGGSSIVRVRLSVAYATCISFAPSGSYSAGGVALASGTTYTAQISGNNVVIYQGGTPIVSGASVYVGQTGGTGNTILLAYSATATRRYLGDINFTISTKVYDKNETRAAFISPINYIDVEQYLYGVVPFEMSNLWPREALKSQAVTARSYTVKRMGRSGSSYDITDSSSVDQVYKGYNADYTNAIAAVNETKGQVLTFGGAIIDCYYSASNGGWTDIPYHRWGGGANWTYYTIVADPYDTANPSALFETVFLPAANTEAGALTIDNYADTEPNSALAITYIKQCIVNSGQLGSITVNDFALTGITSFYTTPPYDTDSGQNHGRTQDLNGDSIPDPNYCVDMIGAAGTFTVTVGGTPYTVSVTNIDLRYLDGTSADKVTAYVSFYQPLGAFFIEPATVNGVAGFNLSQRRYGHACGLSQRGAQQRANSGIGYADILGFYYPGATLTTLSLIDAVNSVNGVSLNYPAVNVAQGSALGLIATVYPATALNKAVTWASDNPGVATVTDGVVTGVSVGTANITATTAEGGFTAVCTVNVKAGTIASSAYAVGVYSISGVKKNTAVASFIAGFNNDAASLHVYNAAGAEVTGGNVGTGMTVALYKDGAEVDRLYIIVRGDVNGDGNVSISDYTLVRYDILSLKPLGSVYKAAGDVNGDGKVSISDYTLIRYDILNLKSL